MFIRLRAELKDRLVCKIMARKTARRPFYEFLKIRLNLFLLFFVYKGEKLIMKTQLQA